MNSDDSSDDGGFNLPIDEDSDDQIDDRPRYGQKQ